MISPPSACFAAHTGMASVFRSSSPSSALTTSICRLSLRRHSQPSACRRKTSRRPPSTLSAISARLPKPAPLSHCLASSAHSSSVNQRPKLMENARRAASDSADGLPSPNLPAQEEDEKRAYGTRQEHQPGAPRNDSCSQKYRRERGIREPVLRGGVYD